MLTQGIQERKEEDQSQCNKKIIEKVNEFFPCYLQKNKHQECECNEQDAVFSTAHRFLIMVDRHEKIHSKGACVRIKRTSRPFLREITVQMCHLPAGSKTVIIYYPFSRKKAAAETGGSPFRFKFYVGNLPQGGEKQAFRTR